MPQVKHWFAAVSPQSTTDPATILAAQANFIRDFISLLFEDSDAGRNGLAAVESIHFARLPQEVRFRVLAARKDLPDITKKVEDRLKIAKKAGLILAYRSEPPGPWGQPGDPSYGTDISGVAEPFAEFLEAVSRATTALLKASGDPSVSETVLWNWLHLLHNQMTGRERIVLDVTGTARKL